MTFCSSTSERNHELWFLSQETDVLYYYIQKVTLLYVLSFDFRLNKNDFYSSISDRNHEVWFLSQETLRPRLKV